MYHDRNVWTFVEKNNEKISLHNAIKADNKYYTCAECKNPALLCDGPIKGRYFKHKGEKGKNSCNYFERTGESDNHKKMKELVKTYLEQGKIMYIWKKCYKCDNVHENILKLEKNYTVKLEYISSYKKWCADICILDENKNIKWIIEIMHTHKTENPRPEPWVELSTKEKWWNKYDENSWRECENINDEIEIGMDCVRDFV